MAGCVYRCLAVVQVAAQVVPELVQVHEPLPALPAAPPYLRSTSLFSSYQACFLASAST